MRAFIAISLAVLLAGPATAAVKKGPKPLHVAQMSLTGAGGVKKVSGGAAYTGPGDVTASFTWWCGFRAYSNATAGTKAIRVRRNSDNTQQDINTLSNGTLDAAALTTFLAATTGNVVTCYDKVGTNDFTQPSAGLQPPILASALNTSYGMTCSSSVELNSSVDFSATGQPASVSVLAKRTSGVTGFSTAWSSDSSGNIQVGFSNAANQGLIFAGTVVSVTGVADNAFHALNVGFNGASTIYNIDGATGTVSPGTSGPLGSSVGNICSAGGLSNSLNGTFMEAGFVATSAFSSGTASSLNSNMHGAYGGF